MDNHQDTLSKDSNTDLPEHISQSSRNLDSVGIKFLLSEFNELAEVWRHTDSRIETAINFYLMLGAITLPGLALLYKAIQNIQLFILASLPVAAVLFIFGYFLTRRIASADIVKAKYVHAMGMIRRFFVDYDPKISAYLFLPIAQYEEKPDKGWIHRQFYFRKSIVLSVQIFNSFLVGLGSCGTIWLIWGKILLPIGIGAISFFMFLASLFLQYLHFRQVFKSKKLIRK